MTDYSGTTILLVEDNAIIALRQRGTLERQGYTVKTVHTGEDAVAVATDPSVPVALILMDIDLGTGMTGIEAARRILAGRDLPVVFLTSHAEQELVTAAQEITRYGYVLKNTGEFMLLQSVRTAIELFAAHRRAENERVRFQSLFNTAPTLAIQGYAPDGTVLYWNRASEELYGYSADEAIGRNLVDLIIPPEMSHEVQQLIRHSAETGEPIPSETLLLRRKDGSSVEVYSRHTVVQYPDRPTEVFCLDADMSRHREMENALRRREWEYRLLVEYQTDLVVRVDPEGRFQFVSDSYCRLFGQEREALLGHSFVPLVHEDDRAATAAARERLFAPPYTCRHEQRALTKEGLRWLEWTDSAIVDDEGTVTAIVGSGRDITERKRAEEELVVSEQRLRRILETLPIPIVISTGANEDVEMVNRAFHTTFGYSAAEIPDVHAWFQRAYPDPDYRAEIAQHWDVARDEAGPDGVIGPVDADVTCHDGTVRHVEARAHTIDQIVVVAFADYTAVRTAQRWLEESLREKDWLMQELNHRTKNNLMLVSALVSMKDENLGDAADLSDIRGQIDAISLIHEKLYAADAVITIDFGSYVETLLPSVFSFYPNGPVAVETHIDCAELPTRTAVTLGIIVNELATNAMKHGFVPGEQARFFVELFERKDDSHRELTVSSSGRTLSETVDVHQAKGLGLRLIGALVQQLGGTFSVERTPKTVFRIRFPQERRPEVR